MPDILVSEAITGAALDALGREFDVAFEPDLWQNVDTLTSRIAQVRGDLAELHEQIRQLEREKAISERVVAMADRDLDEFEPLVARAASSRTRRRSEPGSYWIS